METNDKTFRKNWYCKDKTRVSDRDIETSRSQNSRLHSKLIFVKKKNVTDLEYTLLKTIKALMNKTDTLKSIKKNAEHLNKDRNQFLHKTMTVITRDLKAVQLLVLYLIWY